MFKRQRNIDIAMTIIILCLIANTITGLTWLIKLKQEEPDYLTTGYYVMTIMLLAVPLLVSCFIIVMIVIAIIILIVDRRRRFARFNEFQDNDDE